MNDYIRVITSQIFYSEWKGSFSFGCTVYIFEVSLDFLCFAFTIPVHETSTCIVFVRTNTQKSGIAKMKHIPYQIIQTSIWRNISNVVESCRTNIVNLLPWTNLELGHSNLKKRRSLVFISCPPSRQILACGAFDSYARLLNNTIGLIALGLPVVKYDTCPATG